MMSAQKIPFPYRCRGEILTSLLKQNNNGSPK